MCNNRRTWKLNIILVAAALLAVTAPLIRLVSCVANSIPAERADNTFKSLSLSKHAKRDVANVLHSKRTEHDGDGLRVSRNRDMDFDSYVNEFNMQDEASIPEDILDQQHIQDGDEQYATEPDETDIIFDSEKLVQKNVTPDDVKGTKSEQRSTKATKKYNENLKSKKYSNKRKEYYDDTAFVSVDEATENEQTVNPDMDMSDDGNAHQKLQRIDGEQNHNHQLQQEQVERLNQKQLPSIARLNGRKFNKNFMKKEEEAETKSNRKRKTSKSTNMKNVHNQNKNYKFYEDEYEEDEDEDEDKEEEEVKHKDETVASATIGDIEDNSRNEDEIVESSKTTDDDTDEDKSVAATSSKASQSSQRSIQNRPTQGQTLASEIVGKKTKRFNRVKTFDSGKRQQVAMLSDSGIYYNPNQKHSMNDKEKTDKNNHRHRRPESDATANFQSDYAIENYDSEAPKTRNTSNSFEDIQNDSGQMQQRLANAVLTKENANNGEIEAEQATFQEEHDQGRQYQQRQPTHSATFKSTFEEQKARRRNNRLNGHKSHKKRYKDYLRSAMTPKVTTPTKMVPLATNTEQQNAMSKKRTAAEDPHSNGTQAEIAATLVKLTNKSAENYESKNSEDESENPDRNSTFQRHAEKIKKNAIKIEAEKSHSLPASPIFVAANRNSISAVTAASPTKSFYEGQINYYLETKDDEQKGLEKFSNLPPDTGNWYRRVGPVLRNGIKTSFIEANEPPSKHYYQQQQQQNLHHLHHQHVSHNEGSQQHQEQLPYPYQYKPHQSHQHHNHHHHHNHHQQQHRLMPQHQHHAHHKHQQTNKLYQSAQSNPYQRKLVKKTELGNSISSPLYPTPIPSPSYKPHAGAMQELGHQITEMEEFERYYAKWPHLARVQLQVYDEHFRELHPELYPDYDQDYESAAELEEAENANSEDANLPPYIKKYNRRNKQLLNLLEGTLPSPTIGSFPYGSGHFSSLLQPGPHESNSGTVRIDDDYMKAKRRRYHYRYGNNNNQHKNEVQHDLFTQQRIAANSNDSLTTQRNLTGFNVAAEKPATLTTIEFQNKIPEEDVDRIEEEKQHDEPDWQEEIEIKSNGNDGEKTGNVQMTWQIEKLTTPSTTMTPPKSALFRLPSYPAISGGYIPQPGSHSAQIAMSTGDGKENSFINMHSDYQNFEKTRHMATAKSTVPSESPISNSTLITSPGKSISSFVYHRVVDSAPRFVGAGVGGLKQRLPFVAITDRRIETAKKTLMEHKQDLEQNFYPMP